MTGDSDLPPSVRAGLERAALSSADGRPLAITFATGGFAPLVRNWLAHAGRAGAEAPLVIALDGTLEDALARAGVATVLHAHDGTLADLWFQRMRIFEFLARSGIDFIHSDIDAVWLKDPRPLCFADAGLDLVFSQGTNFPEEVWRRWGFVLCCGLFAAKARNAVADFFAAIASLTRSVGDDQAVVNHLLARDGLVWATEGREGYEIRARGLVFKAYRRMLEGSAERLGLRVGMLPYQLVPRLAAPGPGPLVKHPLGPGAPAEKEKVLRDAGCWIGDPGR